MTQAGSDVLGKLQELIRQLRTVPQVREQRPGTFQLVGQPFVQLHDTDGRLVAELRKSSGTGFDRYPVDTSPEQRKFVDEAKRRAASITDE